MWRTPTKMMLLLITGLVLTASSCDSVLGEPTTTTEPPEECVIRTGDLENCYGFADMAEFYGVAIGLMEEFIGEAYAQPIVMLPDNWWYIAQGEEGESPCLGLDEQNNVVKAYWTDMSYEYCGVDKSVYIGQVALWQFYKGAGDAAAVIAMAHELGHHVQAVVGVQYDSQETYIQVENQADCFAGVFTAWTAEKGYLNYPDDVEDIDIMFVAISELERTVFSTHGTLEERTNSFLAGFNSGMGSCNQFFPATPLMTF